YYGRPWSFNQRKALFEYCLRFGLNTYVYAPKDDAKHRSRWRDLYTNEESNELAQLIHTAKQFGINFVYALSPGLDITYSSEKDLTTLKQKFHQLSTIGCEHWALLFDDIESEMSQQDKENFPSFAHAHVAITNQLYDYLNKPNIFIFCPTVYCSRMAKPSLEKSSYLQTIGNGLHTDIDIFWTGRSLNISRRICGMLLNPNCEFELNFIPLHTLGQWFQLIKINEKQDQFDDDNNIETSEIYQIDKVFHKSLIDWLPEFNKIKSANDSQQIVKIDNSPQGMSPKSVTSLLINDEDSQESINENPTCSSSSKTHIMECDHNNTNNIYLTIDDIRLLVELFYLPYQHGPNIQQVFIDFYWLRFNYNQDQNLNDWRCRASVFHDNAKDISRLLQKLVAIHNRALLYDVYNYINDINSTINLCSKYLYWIDNNQRRSSVFMSGDEEPWSKRGGLAGDFLNLLPLGDFQSLIKSEFNSLSNIFIIRPITSNDHASMYALCTTICYQDDIDDLLNQHSQILADKLIGGYLSSSLNNSDLCYAIDNNEDNLCGFVLTINESEKHDKFIQTKWIDELHQKYPNVDQNFFELIQCPQWIYDRYCVRVQIFIDLTIKTDAIYHLGNKLMKILMKKLSQQGCDGCHALLDERNVALHQFYLYLGFTDIPIIDQNDHIILLGKKF
ncbi:unnamed protein product, partial [Rotaria sordida]